MRRREQRTESAESECGVCFLQYAATEQRERGTIVKRGESGARGGSLAKAGRLTPCAPFFVSPWSFSFSVTWCGDSGLKRTPVAGAKAFENPRARVAPVREQRNAV